MCRIKIGDSNGVSAALRPQQDQVMRSAPGQVMDAETDLTRPKRFLPGIEFAVGKLHLQSRGEESSLAQPEGFVAKVCIPKNGHDDRHIYAEAHMLGAEHLAF